MVMKEFTAGERLFAADLNDNFDETQLAGNILSGTLADARIPNLNASKITAGVLAGARIPIKGIGSNVKSSSRNTVFTFNSGASFVLVPGISTTITPSSASSKILIAFFSTWTCEQDGASLGARFRRNGTPILIGSGGSRQVTIAQSQPLRLNVANLQRVGCSAAFQGIDSPATTSAVTYTIDVIGGAGRLGSSRSDSAHITPSILIATEIAG